MAQRFYTEFINLHGEVFNISIDDSDYSDTAVEIETLSDGFALSYDGERVLASKVTVSALVTPDTDTAFDSFLSDLLTAEESRFTIKITWKPSAIGSAQLYWVGYVLPDLSGYDDLETYTFSIVATDGIGRLKGFDYADDSGLNDVPFGFETITEHLLRCLTNDALSGLYYNASTDIFLRTVVNWHDAIIGAPATAVCPTARMQISGEIFAEKDTSDDGDGWKFKTYYDVLDQICLHLDAKLYYSLGCYRFEQKNERTLDIFTERRFSANGTLVGSSATTGYDKTINQAFTGFKISTIHFGFQPALKKIVGTYAHHTYKNYLAGLSFKWYKTSQNNSPYTISNISVDSDTRLKITGRLNLNASVSSYTEPWRYIFAMTVTTSGGYKLRSLTDAIVDGSGNGTNLINREVLKWEISSVVYEITTDFQFSDNFNGYVNFTAITPVLPSGTDSITIDFTTYGGEDNENNVQLVTLNDWQFTDLVLNIIGFDDAENYEDNRVYLLNNPVSGSSEKLEIDQLFGHAVKPWTVPKILTSSDGSTWEDTTGTWAHGTQSTNYEFGALMIAEIMSARRTPVKIMQGSINGAAIHAHSRLVTPDTLGWMMRQGTFYAKPGTWDGEWINAGIDRITSATIKKKIAIPPEVVINTPVPGTVEPQGIHSPTTGKGNIALSAVTTNHTSAAIPAGSVSSVPLQFAVAANAYLENDDIFIVNPQTGEMLGLTVSATAAEGATSLSVISATAASDFPIGSHVVYSALNKFTGEGGSIGGLPAGTNDEQLLKWDGTKWNPYTITASRLLGRGSSTSDSSEEIQVGSGLSLSGNVLSAAGGSGTVTSVGLTMPGIFGVSGSPITGAGTLAVSLANQSANTVFAGPASGGAAAPTFRALTYADVSGAYTFSNALTNSAGSVKWGGALVENTLVSGAFKLNFTVNKITIGTTSTSFTASTVIAKNGTGSGLGSVALHLAGNGGDNNAKLSFGVGDAYSAGIGYFFGGGTNIFRMYHMNSSYNMRWAIGGETSDKMVMMSNNIGRLGVGFANTTGLHSTLQTAGSFAGPVATKNGNFSFSESDWFWIFTGTTGANWTLPAPGGVKGRWYLMANLSSGQAVTLSHNVKQSNGSTFNQIFYNQWAVVISDGVQWTGFKVVSL